MARILNPRHRSDGWNKRHDEITGGNVIWEDWYGPMLTEFAQIISSSNIVCVGSVVDAVAYRQIREAGPENFELVHEDSNVFAFQTAATLALDRIDTLNTLSPMTICIDDDQETSFDYYKAYWNLRKMLNHPHLPNDMRPRFERFKQRVDQISFASDGFHAALQAADMIAYVSRAWKTEENKGLDPFKMELFEELFAHLTFGGSQQPKMFSKKDLLGISGGTARSLKEARDAANCERV
jgi:hypothetical protein